MRVLAVASEYFPLVKTGGLADVAGALPAALAAEGVAVRSLIPGYPAVLAALGAAETVIRHDEFFGGPARLLAAGALFVLDAPHLYDRPGNPYAGPDGRDWPDNLRRFTALARMAADLALGALPGWRPDLVHAHDWQAGLVPAFLHHAAAAHPPSVMTVHNLAFQGRFPMTDFPGIGLPPAAMRMEELEFHGDLSLLKAGLVHADRVTTVSPTYAAEIQTAEHGMGLDGVLRATGVTGILNGIDVAAWNPATDPHLAQGFTAATVARRAVNKAAIPGVPRSAAGPRGAAFRRGQPVVLAEGPRSAAGNDPSLARGAAGNWPCSAPASRRLRRASAPQAPIRPSPVISATTRRSPTVCKAARTSCWCRPASNPAA